MSLADIRAKLMAQENRSQQNQTASVGDNAVYPFWNMPDNTTSVIRFLPDGDPSNSFFWIERAMIRLPFTSIKGQPESNKEHIVQVPCMEMYGENCPIISEVRTWYKDESLKETANKYWKKRTYLFQGFVRSSSLNEENAPENPIRRFVISPQIFTVIKSSLMDPEIEELPTDFMRGLDFRVAKTKKGDYADYTTSGWARKESALTEVERLAIDTHGLFNLREFLPKKPSDAELRVIKEMFEASVDGRAYDPDRWGAYFKPWGLQVAGNSTRNEDEEPVQRKSVAQEVKPVVQETVAVKSNNAPWEESEQQEEPKQASSNRTDEILKMIRSRQNKTA